MMFSASARRSTKRWPLWLAVVLFATISTGAYAEELERDAESGLEYLQVLTGGAGPDDAVPVVVALHGLGDRPEDFRILLDDLPVKARIILPRGPMPHGDDGFSWFNFRANDLEGVAEMTDGISSSAERIATLLVAVMATHHSPPRAVVCGFSQGGMLSFALAAAHPELLARAIPIAGYLPTSLWPASRPKARPLPTVLALHGEGDPLIPLQSAKWSVEALRSNGYDAGLKSWPGVGHAISREMRAALLAEVAKAAEELSPPAAAAQVEVPTGPPTLPTPDKAPAAPSPSVGPPAP